MKKAALFVGGLLLATLACAPAMAEVVRVRLTARVLEVNDPQNQLNGKIIPAQRMTGTYVYNTNTPNQFPFPDAGGEYVPYANEARVRFVAGGLVFENVQPTQGIRIIVNPERNFNPGQFSISSNQNKLLSTGAGVDFINIYFHGQGNLTQTIALPAVVPALSGYQTKEVRIFGVGPGGFQVIAGIELAELIVPDAIEVSPAAGSFVPGQQFDAALTLPRNSNVVSAQATANGAPLPLNYPGYCTLVPPNTAGKPALLCPAADTVLPLAAGAPIEWSVVLSNGTTLTETVEWTLAQ